MEIVKHMEHLSSENEEILRLFIIAAAFIGAILSTIFSLTHGIFEVFPFLYILPIILVVYFYPKRTIVFALFISVLYISLVYLFDYSNTFLIAVSTAWFAIFMIIAVVASSYANQLLNEKVRIHHIIENSMDGMICIDIASQTIGDINPKCARWLKYGREELIHKNISEIWQSASEREEFIAEVIATKTSVNSEGIFKRKDNSILRFLVSAVMVTKKQIVCSVIDITGSKIADEEIRQTLEDLEKQVRERTAHLEKINEDLREEINELRRNDANLIAGHMNPDEDKP
jgi:PAS domain S-box-containing protein